MKKHPIRNALALVVLALFCICGVELAVARVKDPALYAELTAPAREAFADAGEQLSDYYEQLCLQIEQRRAERELKRAQELERQRELELRRELQRQRELAATELAIQLASRPTIVEELVPADPAITEFRLEDGRETLTGGNLDIIYYNQGDEQWANELFGSDPIGGYGCGPTALAMAVASMTDPEATPSSVAAWSARAGYCAPRSGSYLSIVQGVSEHYGISCESLGAVDAQELYERLSEGGVIVALMGPGHFTGRGHFILLHGVTLSGEILVADPNSRENSLSPWDPQTIADELSQSRHDGAPMWQLTVPVE